MNISSSLLPTSIWGIATGLSLVIVLVTCAMYFWYRQRIAAAIGDESDVATLAAKKQQLEAEVAQSQNWIAQNRDELLRLEAERQEQERIRIELTNLLTQAATEQQKIENMGKEAVALQNAVMALGQDRDRLQTETQKLQTERVQAEQAKKQLDGVVQRLDEEKKRFDLLIQNVAQNEVKQQSLIGEISARQAQLEQLQKELKQGKEEWAKLKADTVPLKEVIAEKERVRKDRDILLEEKRQLEDARGNLKKDVDILEKKLRILRDEAGPDADPKERYADLFAEPECLSNKLFERGSHNNLDERQALAKLQESLKNRNLFFSERTLKAFHTSLKINDISPLTVLAGVSGTGKTRLPIEYAEAMGMHKLMVSVQPGWDSPHNLFGFYNYMERKYKATDLARALMRMDAYNIDALENERSERMLLVLLDEMNLARVEYYFSEFLSKLELRLDRNEEDPTQRSLAEIELETGPRSSAENSHRLWVGKNILFVGTMNEDESTQTLSDKVLDRANVMRFGKPPEGLPNLSNQILVNATQDRYLPYNTWKSWIKTNSGQWGGDLDKWIELANRALGRIGRPFGHRVQRAIREYVRNYPGVDDGQSHRLAFADQLEQKVIPKLRGIELEGNAVESLDELQSLIDETGDLDLRNAFADSIDERSTGTFVWRGVTRPVQGVPV